MCIMLMKNCYVHLQIMINIADKRSPSSVALNARSYAYAHSVPAQPDTYTGNKILLKTLYINPMCMYICNYQLCIICMYIRT